MAKQPNPHLTYTNLAGEECKSRLLELPLGQVRGLTLRGFGGKDYRLYEWPEQLREMPHLETLDITSSPLHELPHWLEELTQLRSLHLSETKIQRLPDSLASLSHLTEFGYMEDGADPEQVCGVLAQCPALQTLYFRDDKMTRAPLSLFDCSGLTTMHLRSTKLVEISPAIGQLTGLVELHLGGDLRELPDELGQLTNLEVLVFDWSRKVSAIPDTFAQLTKLKKFVFNHAKIKALPANWTDLTAMEELELRGNKIKVFPGDISRMTALRTLDLGYNELAALPEGITRLRGLVKVDFQGNEDETLHKQCMETCHIVQEEMFIRGPLTEKEQALANPRKVIVSWDSGAIPDEFVSWLGTRSQITSLEFRRSVPGSLVPITQLVTLEKLELDNVGECSLPALVGDLQALRVLQAAYGTTLASLPSSVASLQALRELYVCLVSGDALVLPPGLQKLHLHFSQGEVADVFGACDLLEVAEIMSPSISKLPESMASLSSLARLTLGCGDGFDWAQSASLLARLSSLRHLEIRHRWTAEEERSLPSQLTTLGQIEGLYCYDVNPGETTLPPLHGMESLKRVLFCGEAVSSDDKKRLKKLLPNGGKGWRQEQHTKGYGGLLIYGRE